MLLNLANTISIQYTFMRKTTAGLWALIIVLLLSACKKENLTAAVTTTKQAAKAINKNGPLAVVYTEVNNNNLLNSGCYTLKTSGEQLFDISIIFAANINYDVATHKAVLFNNENVTLVLNGNAQYIKPLQDKGIKVLLSILGNHQGAGISNFTSRTAAHDFALQLSNAVSTYGLDGIDFDDEYADYGNNGTPQPNDSSFVMLLGELRSLMPDKIISFYYYGPASSRLTYKNEKAGDYLDYSWNAIYGTYIVPAVPGLNKTQLAPAAVWINNTPLATAKNLARRTVTDGYGAYLCYDLGGNNASAYLSGISMNLYNDSVVADNDCLQSWPPPADTSGVVFFQDINYQGSYTLPIPKGNYSLTKLAAYGFKDDWASSVYLPYGWKMVMFSEDRFFGTKWPVRNDKPDFTLLHPSANDRVSSVIIR